MNRRRMISTFLKCINMCGYNGYNMHYYMNAKVNLFFMSKIIMKMWMKTNVYLHWLLKNLENLYVVNCCYFFILPGLIKCRPPAGNVSSLHQPDPGDCLYLRLSPSSALSHLSCTVVWSVAITSFKLYIMHTYTTVIKKYIHILVNI